VTCRWEWPSDLTYQTTDKAWILNGPYQVKACVLAAGSDVCTYSSKDLTIAVASQPATTHVK